MKNMACSLTTRQVKAQTKDVSRRLGWFGAKPGDRICLIEKGQGLKKGQKIRRLAVVEIISNDNEHLTEIVSRPIRDTEYGNVRTECRREGFPDMTEIDFCLMFAEHMPAVFDYDGRVNRLEWRYLTPIGWNGRNLARWEAPRA